MTTYQPQNILITGGAGFIGSNFIHYALEHSTNTRLINLDALTYAGSLDHLASIAETPRYQFIQGNICDRPLIERLLTEYDIDTIVHFAAESHVDRSITAPETFIQTNLVGTFTLLDTAKQYWLEQKRLQASQCRFYHISTDEVYGSLTVDAPTFTERSKYCPNSPYSASKAGSDHLVHAYHKTYGLPVIISNCSNNYGPRQHPEKFIPTVIKSCLEQRNIPIYGNGTNIRDWLYVIDHCAAIMTLLHQGQLGETYNISGDNEQPNNAVVLEICSIMDELFPDHAPHARLMHYITDRLGHDWRYGLSSNKLQSELGWHPTLSFRSGLMHTIKHYLKLFEFAGTPQQELADIAI